jgi:hypothetical protein
MLLCAFSVDLPELVLDTSLAQAMIPKFFRSYETNYLRCNNYFRDHGSDVVRALHQRYARDWRGVMAMPNRHC